MYQIYVSWTTEWSKFTSSFFLDPLPTYENTQRPRFLSEQALLNQNDKLADDKKIKKKSPNEKKKKGSNPFSIEKHDDAFRLVYQPLAIV